MPAVLALPALWGAVGAGAGAAAGIYGAHKAGESNDAATATSERSNLAAIEEQKRQDAQQKAQFDQQQAMAKAQWDAEQQIRAPYRQAGLSALMRLGDLTGSHFDASMLPAPTYTPPVAPPMAAPPPASASMKLNALWQPNGPGSLRGPVAS